MEFEIISHFQVRIADISEHKFKIKIVGVLVTPRLDNAPIGYKLRCVTAIA